MNKQEAKQNRHVAKMKETMTFMGLDCIRLHGGERYTVSGGCIVCAQRRNKLKNRMSPEKIAAMKQAAINREKARKKGKNTFQGTPCARGHNGIRYVSSRSCIQCISLSNSKYTEEESKSKTYHINWSHGFQI